MTRVAKGGFAKDTDGMQCLGRFVRIARVRPVPAERSHDVRDIDARVIGNHL